MSGVQQPVRYASGALLFKIGDIASAVYYIRAGQVLLEAGKGARIPPIRLFRGELCGECAWNQPAIHNATATVLEEAEMWLFSLEQLYALLRAGQPGIAQAVQAAKAREQAWRQLREKSGAS